MGRRIRIRLEAFIRAQRIEYYGEEGVFVPFRYNTSERGGCRFVEITMRPPRRKAGAEHDMEGMIVVPEEQRGRMLMNEGTTGIARPVLFEYGESRRKRGTPRAKLTKGELDTLFGEPDEKEVNRNELDTEKGTEADYRDT